jgi:hypothetical protein
MMGQKPFQSPLLPCCTHCDKVLCRCGKEEVGSKMVPNKTKKKKGKKSGKKEDDKLLSIDS